MTYNDSREQVDTIELDGEAHEPDCVVIYETPTLQAEYEAIPFAHECGDIFGELGAEFEATDDYAEAVRERTHVDGEIQFERNWVEPEEEPVL